MSVIEQHPQSYILGQLTIEKDGDNRFVMRGNWADKIRGTDHMQIIYEALEIAANSNDPFAKFFEAMLKEFVDITEHWVD